MKTLLLLIFLTIFVSATKLEVEILGSGGPEIDGRASSSYIVWIDNKARLLIDTGSGSLLGFEKSGAKIEDLEAILLTHLHIDHVVDLPSYIKAGYFSSRTRVLNIVGPQANASFPSLDEFLSLQFGPHGAYRYMQDVLTPESDSFEIKSYSLQPTSPKDMEFNGLHPKSTSSYLTAHVKIISVNHGIVPALAYRIDIGDKSIVFSGDTSNQKNTLSKILQDADIFIAHHAIPQGARGYATSLHMKPSQIALLIKNSGVKKVVLSHRMRRTLGEEEESLKIIKENFKGEVLFAEDGMKIIF